MIIDLKQIQQRNFQKYLKKLLVDELNIKKQQLMRKQFILLRKAVEEFHKL